MKESGGSGEQGRIQRSRSNWGLLRTPGLAEGWSRLCMHARLHLSVTERCSGRSQPLMRCGKEGIVDRP